MSDALQSQLQTYYTRAFLAKQQVRVTHFASLEPGGMEHEMYAFDVEYGAAGERQQEGLILRLYPGDAAYATSAHEFHGMRRLYEAGYPVPQVLLLERDHSPFGKPFVMMERIEGQELGSLLFILIVSTSRGMHPNAEYMMQVGAFKRAYDLLQERTGIRWVEVERLLASLS